MGILGRLGAGVARGGFTGGAWVWNGLGMLTERTATLPVVQGASRSAGLA